MREPVASAVPPPRGAAREWLAMGGCTPVHETTPRQWSPVHPRSAGFRRAAREARRRAHQGTSDDRVPPRRPHAARRPHAVARVARRAASSAAAKRRSTPPVARWRSKRGSPGLTDVFFSCRRARETPPVFVASVPPGMRARPSREVARGRRSSADALARVPVRACDNAHACHRRPARERGRRAARARRTARRVTCARSRRRRAAPCRGTPSMTSTRRTAAPAA